METLRKTTSRPAGGASGQGGGGRQAGLDRLIREIRACRTCRDAPAGKPLPHEPRPVVRASATATICIVGQAPGTRVHTSGKPFTDPSGDRLRDWMGIDAETFYDERRIAIVPMGFCFPGQDARGADLPPRKECAPAWQARLLGHLPNIRLMLLVGSYAQTWHLGDTAGKSLTATVAAWREIAASTNPVMLPMPHPSWRNNGWLRKNPWFEADLLPWLRSAIAGQLGKQSETTGAKNTEKQAKR